MLKLPAIKSARFAYLKENKEMIILDKKSAMKFGDGFATDYMIYIPAEKKFKQASVATKAEDDFKAVDNNGSAIRTKVVINSTNLLDSHQDVHIPGLWKKSVSENKNVKFLSQHSRGFRDIIADKQDLKVLIETYTWKELGFGFKGNTECLVFDAVVREERCSSLPGYNGMYEQYSKGYVDQHSVGMQYVEMFLCINDESKYYIEEFENWNKYITYVVNKEAAISDGHFWAITQAKVIEGSAVVFGSNYATPTLEVSNNAEPDKSTQQKPQPRKALDYSYLRENLKIC